MTGFGRGVAKAGGARVTVELRSVNQRFLRVGVKVPHALAALEPRVREIVTAGARRGQIDALVSLEDGAAGTVPVPDVRRVRRYVEAWRKIARELGLPGEPDVGTLAGMPELFACDEETTAAARARSAVEKAARGALRALDRMRTVEGRRLARDLLARTGHLVAAAKRIERRSKLSAPEQAGKLRARVKAIMAGAAFPKDALDPGALEREVALKSCMLADRADVSEELERIASHTEQFRSTLSAGSPAGRKLDFLVQELQREITTLGAKVADARAGREAVEFRSELERMREQVQNIE